MHLRRIACSLVTTPLHSKVVTMRRRGSTVFLAPFIEPVISPHSVVVAEKATALMGSTISNIFSIKMDKQHKAWRRHRGPKRKKQGAPQIPHQQPNIFGLPTWPPVQQAQQPFDPHMQPARKLDPQVQMAAVPQQQYAPAQKLALPQPPQGGVPPPQVQSAPAGGGMSDELMQQLLAEAQQPQK